MVKNQHLESLNMQLNSILHGHKLGQCVHVVAFLLAKKWVHGHILGQSVHVI